MDMGKCVCGQNTKALKDKMKMYQFEFETREQSTQESYNFFFHVEVCVSNRIRLGSFCSTWMVIGLVLMTLLLSLASIEHLL